MLRFGCDYICKTVQIMDVLGRLMIEFHNHPVNYQEWPKSKMVYRPEKQW